MKPAGYGETQPRLSDDRLPIVLVILDGLGDRSIDELGGRTPADAAHTPNLDELARRGSSGWHLPFGWGRAPASELAHWAMFGYAAVPFRWAACAACLPHVVLDVEHTAPVSVRSSSGRSCRSSPTTTRSSAGLGERQLSIRACLRWTLFGSVPLREVGRDLISAPIIGTTGISGTIGVLLIRIRIGHIAEPGGHMPDTVVAPPVSPQVVTWGKLVQAVYAQFEAAPQELNPTTLPGMPDGFHIVRNIQMSDFLTENEPPDDRKFYGVLAGDAAGNLVVALRGTETFTEWWDDLHFALTSFDGTVANGGNVVDGFYRIYKTLTSTDPNDPTAAPSGLFGHIDDNAPLTVTGHSLGAALATLLTVDMFVNAHLRPEVWTFGSPKVGDATFAAIYGYHATVSWRIYNVLDVVPLAPIDLFGHYQHVNTGYPINSGDSTRASLGCFHHLTTYLSVLSGGSTPVDPGCLPLT